MKKEDIQSIVDDITLPEGWGCRVLEKGDGFLIQIYFWAKDNQSIIGGDWQMCRKWYVSSFSTPTEVVRTVYKAGLAALEHEFDEQFKYKGHAIYNPHLNVDDLVNTHTEERVTEDRRPDVVTA